MSSSGSNGGGPEFDLPDEILSVIPTDPYEQLDLARKITSMAIASRVSKLESDTSCMRQKLHEKERVVFELEEKVLRLERSHRDADSRLKAALDENMKLSNERDSLSMTVKKLSRDLVKLETFKRQLMQSLNDDNSSHVETIDIGTYNQLNPKFSLENGANGYGSHQSFNGTADFGNSMDENSRHAVQKFTISPYITPRLTPSGTPKIISTAGSPRTYSSAGSPQRTSGATSPIKPQHEGGNIMSSWYPSSQQSSAANSPPRGRSLPGRPPRIDGKEFFRQAKTRLSYEQFSAFLANIKELNARKQTREETLRKAEEIFGTDNKDLYLSFQGLLNRKVH